MSSDLGTSELDSAELGSAAPGSPEPETSDRGASDRGTSALERLSAGTLAWLGQHLDHFDPYSVRARSSAHAKAKAALELALLCHCWARLDTGDDVRLGKATALVRTLWQHPDFPRLLTAEPRYAAQYGLVYAALAPDGIDRTPCRAALARLTEDDLSPRGKSAYQRLELRYYADKAGVRHTLEPYKELARQNVLVTLPGPVRDRAVRDSAARERSSPVTDAPVTDAPDTEVPRTEAPVTVPEAYAVTHSAFYLSDFGRIRPVLSDEASAAAAELVRRLLEHCVRHDWWDLAAELLMTQVCLGLDPLSTPAGLAAVDCLARAQRPDGAIPGRSAATAAPATAAGTAATAAPAAPAAPAVTPTTPATAAEPDGGYFEKAYHTTLVTALMSLLVSSARAS